MSTDHPTITTNLGHAGWHDHEVRGVITFELESEQTSIPDLMLLTLGVPTIHPEARKVIELCVVAGLNPDPRIPPMKLVRLGAAYGGLLSALAVGFAGMHRSRVGMSAIVDAGRFLQELRESLGSACSDAELYAALKQRRSSKSGIHGFGVPGRRVDERVVWLSARLEQAISGPRPWWRFFERIGARLAPSRLCPNIGGALAAALLDLGCSPEQAGAGACLLGLMPLMGNALEGSMQAPEVLRELPPSSSVDYAGPPPRASPRSAGATE